MRYLRAVLPVVAAVAALGVAPAADQAAVRPPCSASKARAILRSAKPLTAVRRSKAHRYSRCHPAVFRHWYRWRKGHPWHIRWRRIPTARHSELAVIAQCESHGNPRAIGGGGAFRGKYQFDMGTWHGVGGSGDPIDAIEREQDVRASTLMDRRGHQPWPVCG